MPNRNDCRFNEICKATKEVCGYCGDFELIDEPVKPDCEYTKRPTIKSYFPEDMTVGRINNTFLKNKELYNYIQALDSYIDELESKQI